MNSQILIIIVLEVVLSKSKLIADQGLTGYRCDDPKVITEYSLLDIKECDIVPESHKITRSGTFQIIQDKKVSRETAVRCQVRADIRNYVCDFNWSAVGTGNFETNSVVEVSPRECQEMHRNERYTAPDGKDYQLKLNTTTEITVNLNGYIDSDFNCYGESRKLSDGRHYQWIVTIANYRITLETGYTYYKLGDNSIRYQFENSQYDCEIGDEFCITPNDGTLIWSHKSGQCEVDALKTLQASIHESLNYPKVLVSTEQLIRLEMKTEVVRCARNMYTTNFPHVYVYEILDPKWAFENQEVLPQNIDLMLQFNQKLQFVYQDLISKTEQVYVKSLREICHQERKLLFERLRIIRSIPGVGEFSIMDQPGVFSRTIGEVLYSFSCTPVKVKIRPQTFCSNELAVSVENDDTPYYLTPVSRVLTTNATEIDCSTIMSSKFKYSQDQWIQIVPEIQPTASPNIIPIREYSNLTFKRISNFSSGGLYTQEQIESAKNLIMFPQLRRASENMIVRQINNKISSSSIDWKNLLENAPNVENKVITFFQKIFSGLTTFGTYVAAFYGIFVIWGIISNVLKTGITAWTIYTVHGVSKKLFYAIFSCTRYAYLQGIVTKSHENIEREGIELRELKEERERREEQNPSSSPPMYPDIRRVHFKDPIAEYQHKNDDVV